MSMWEIETLGEGAIRLIDKMDASAVHKRDLILTSYAEIEKWDTSFIHFRTLDILQRNHCFTSLAPKDHPEYEARKAELDGFVRGGGSWLYDSVQKRL